MRITVALLSVVVFLGISPGATEAHHSTLHTRCTQIVGEVSRVRTAPDLRIKHALCIIGRERAKTFAHAGRAWHNVDYAIRRLREMGYSWAWNGDFCGIGEVIGQTSARGTEAVSRIVQAWRASPSHWSVINSRTYQRGGGYYAHISGAYWTFFAFYTLDETC